MAGVYSVDLRRRVVAAYHRGEGTPSEIAELFLVTERTVENYIYLERDTGDVLPKSRKRGWKSGMNSQGEELILSWVKERSELTLAELCNRYKALYKKTISRAAMSRACNYLSIANKELICEWTIKTGYKKEWRMYRKNECLVSATSDCVIRSGSTFRNDKFVWNSTWRTAC